MSVRRKRHAIHMVRMMQEPHCIMRRLIFVHRPQANMSFDVAGGKHPTIRTPGKHGDRNGVWQGLTYLTRADIPELHDCVISGTGDNFAILGKLDTIDLAGMFTGPQQPTTGYLPDLQRSIPAATGKHFGSVDNSGV